MSGSANTAFFGCENRTCFFIRFSNSRRLLCLMRHGSQSPSRKRVKSYRSSAPVRSRRIASNSCETGLIKNELGGVRTISSSYSHGSCNKPMSKRVFIPRKSSFVERLRLVFPYQSDIRYLTSSMSYQI